MLKITIITLGNKMPSWVEIASREYSKRLSEFAQLNIIEIPLINRGKGQDLERIIDKEALKIKKHIPKSSYIIALDITGKYFSSDNLAANLDKLQLTNSNICFLIGGPEGLAPDIVTLSELRLSLSPLTLPHTLVRVVLLETLYRCFSILANHPYHK